MLYKVCTKTAHHIDCKGLNASLDKILQGNKNFRTMNTFLTIGESSVGEI